LISLIIGEALSGSAVAVTDRPLLRLAGFFDCGYYRNGSRGGVWERG